MDLSCKTSASYAVWTSMEVCSVEIWLVVLIRSLNTFVDLETSVYVNELIDCREMLVYIANALDNELRYLYA